VEHIIIDESSEWDFFDGDYQGNPYLYGVEGTILLKASHHLDLLVGLGCGTNNWAKLRTSVALLRMTMELGVEKLQVHGYSKLIKD